MKKKLAFVLSGGGSRGALQVGALRALLDCGIQPDIFVGTSIGAVNAAFLALNGYTQNSLRQLSIAWSNIANENLLPSNHVWLVIRSVFGRSVVDPSHKIRDFLIRQGITAELTFEKLRHPPLVIVSSDLNTGKPVLHGLNPEEKVLDALLLSTALPPWVMPVEKQGRCLMDGGAVSNLPVEPAIEAGAKEIIALDLLDMRRTPGLENGLGRFVDSLSMAVEKRQSYLELQLASARAIQVHHIPLMSIQSVAYWDFKHTVELIEQGYEQTLRLIPTWQHGYRLDWQRNKNLVLEEALQELE
jgi:NTE family protein